MKADLYQSAEKYGEEYFDLWSYGSYKIIL